MINEEKVKELAYQLWENNGCPEGKDLDFYFEAMHILEENEKQEVADITID